jgi:hypothetical protein
MAEYRYSISLRVTHPTMDLDVVTDVLGITPGVIQKIGEPRRTPGGTTLPGHYTGNFWTSRLADDESIKRDLNSALNVAMDAVVAGCSLFGEIAKTGGRTEFFIGWFFDEGNSGDVLEHRLLARLGSMCIDLSFDVYGNASVEGGTSDP